LEKKGNTMKANDILMKKWCFGTGRSKARNEAGVNSSGELVTYKTYPKYRTIIFKVDDAKRVGDDWHVTGKQYASLNAAPKKKTIVLTEKHGCFYSDGQKCPFLKMQDPNTPTDSGLPPVGSLISVNKKHAIVTEVGRNCLTVYVSGGLQTIACKPGTVKWFSDKILKSVV